MSNKEQWILLVGQLTASLITALKGGGLDAEATQLQVIAHSNETWKAVLTTAQSAVPPPPGD